MILVDKFKEKKELQTLSFYQKNAAQYFSETVDLDISSNRERFLNLIPNKGHILDLGCGSGRDSRFFLDNNYRVTPLDASQELATLASDFIGKPVEIISFYELNYFNAFDGIWACASLLHCPKAEMGSILKRITYALKPQGLVYMSFKLGVGERIDEKGRFFNDYTEMELVDLLKTQHCLSLVDSWVENKPLRSGMQSWVNTLVKKESNK